MFDALSDVDLPVLAKLLRRTVVMSLVVGAAAIAVCLVTAPALAAVGVALGLGGALLNMRFVDAGVAKVETTGETNEKTLRRLLGTRTIGRLSIITVVAIGLLLLDAALGIGVVVGLVIFQIVFVFNVLRALAGGGVA